MLYSNLPLYSAPVECDFGTLNAIILGEGDEYGCNRVFMVCPSPTKVHRGMNRYLTIALSFNHNPKVIKKKDDDLYMILSSKGGSTSKGNGGILVLENQHNQFEVLARAHGGDIKFIPCECEDSVNGYLAGHWEHLTLKVPTDDAIIQVRTSGGMYGDPPSDLYLIHHGRVHHCTYKTLEMLCSSLGIPVPCEIFPNGWGNLKLGGNWVML